MSGVPPNEKKYTFLPKTLDDIFRLFFSKENCFFLLQMMENCRIFLVEKKRQCQCDLISSCCCTCIFQFIELMEKVACFKIELYAFKASVKYNYKYYFGCNIFEIMGQKCPGDLDKSNGKTKEFFLNALEKFSVKQYLHSPFSYKLTNHEEDLQLNSFKYISTMKIALGVYYFGIRSQLKSTVHMKFKTNLLFFIEQEIEKKFVIKEDPHILILFESLMDYLSKAKNPGMRTFINIFQDWYNNFTNIHCKKK